MKYEEVVRYIEDIPKFTKKHTLLHTREFMRRLGNPCQGRKVLHVAGTNGKGSVCAYMQAILLFEGKRVGFFTSPHLVKLNERIRINGKDIDDDTFCRIFAKVRQVAEELEKEGLEHPSYFEFLYGMGMLAFEENDAEYIVLETGLGGRLDATNSFEHPFLSVITSIGLDHTEILGDTIEKIAGEKAEFGFCCFLILYFCILFWLLLFLWFCFVFFFFFGFRCFLCCVYCCCCFCFCCFFFFCWYFVCVFFFFCFFCFCCSCCLLVYCLFCCFVVLLCLLICFIVCLFFFVFFFFLLFFFCCFFVGFVFCVFFLCFFGWVLCLVVWSFLHFLVLFCF